MCKKKAEWNKRICEYSKFFKASEFQCNCGECLTTAYLNPRLIVYLDEMRRYFRKPVHITSGIRCKDYNDSLVNSSPTSGHLKGNAADVYIKGVSPDAIVAWWTSNVPSNMAYCGTSNMGNCAHVEVL